MVLRVVVSVASRRDRSRGQTSRINPRDNEKAPPANTCNILLCSALLVFHRNRSSLWCCGHTAQDVPDTNLGSISPCTEVVSEGGHRTVCPARSTVLWNVLVATFGTIVHTILVSPSEFVRERHRREQLVRTKVVSAPLQPNDTDHSGSTQRTRTPTANV